MWGCWKVLSTESFWWDLGFKGNLPAVIRENSKETLVVIQEKNGPGREAGGRCIVKEMNTEKLICHPVGHKGERKHVAGGWHWGGHRYRCLRAGGQERRRSVEQRSMFCSFCCLCVHSSPESEVPPQGEKVQCRTQGKPWNVFGIDVVHPPQPYKGSMVLLPPFHLLHHRALRSLFSWVWCSCKILNTQKVLFHCLSKCSGVVKKQGLESQRPGGGSSITAAQGSVQYFTFPSLCPYECNELLWGLLDR